MVLNLLGYKYFGYKRWEPSSHARSLLEPALKYYYIGYAETVQTFSRLLTLTAHFSRVEYK